MKIWIHLNGVQEGPFDFDTLPSDRITPQTPVWHSGLEYWVEASKCPELAYLFVPKPEPEHAPVPEPEEITIEVTEPEPKPEVKAEDEAFEISVEAPEAKPEGEEKDELDDLIGAAEHMAEAVAARAKMGDGADEVLDIECEDKPETEKEEISDIDIEPVKTDEVGKAQEILEAVEPESENFEIEQPVAEQPETEQSVAEQPIAEQLEVEDSDAEQPAAQTVPEDGNSDASRPWEGGRRAQFPQGPQFDYGYQSVEQPIISNVFEASQQPALNAPANHKKPKSYIVWSILLTLFCVNPLGIIAFIYGLLVSKRYNNFDFDGAERASETAQWWLAITIVTGLISLPFMTILNL